MNEQPGSESGKALGGDLSFDQVLEILRKVIERLESSELTLEQSLEAFEQGVRLSRRGAALLDAAERRVEVLLKGENGQVRTEPIEKVFPDASDLTQKPGK